MPPLSRVPGRARGEVWTETTAMLHMRPSMIIQPAIPANGAAVDGDVVGAEVVLVGLAPAQEIEPALPLVDRLLQRQRLGEQADGEGGVGGGVAAVVGGGPPTPVGT